MRCVLLMCLLGISIAYETPDCVGKVKIYTITNEGLCLQEPELQAKEVCKIRFKASSGTLALEFYESSIHKKNKLAVFDAKKGAKKSKRTLYYGTEDKSFMSSSTYMFIKTKLKAAKKDFSFKSRIYLAGSTPPNCEEPEPEPEVTEPTGEDCKPPAITPKSTRMQRIVGGVDAEQCSLPWQAFLQVGGYMCGGSLISDQWVLTAAHCVDGISASNTQVTLGLHERSSSGAATEIGAEEIIMHESYNSNTLQNDIALIKLDRSVSSSFGDCINPICLGNMSLSDEQTTLVSGWGTVAEGGYTSNVLQQAYVPIVKPCPESGILDGMICAGYDEGGTDACQGDSGGPLVADVNGNGIYLLYGIVSWGYGCAREGHPGVYTDVHAYRNWIGENMK